MRGAAFSYTEGTDVQTQLSKRTSESVPMNAQRAGSFGLVPLQVSHDRYNELFFEFSDGVRKRGARSYAFAAPKHRVGR